MKWLLYRTSDGTLLAPPSDTEPTPGAGESKVEVEDFAWLPVQKPHYLKWDGSNVVPNDEEVICEFGCTYEIEEDADDTISKDFRAVNYKAELKSGIAYTPVYVIHKEGINSGLIDKTQYYRGYQDAQNPGTLVLEVHESYVLDQTDPTAEKSAYPAVSRVKTWKHVKKSDGQLDEVNTKTRAKLYDTRRKSHIEGKRRRENIQEQLIDHVALAGIVTGTFADSADAYDKLTQLQIDHSSAFNAWINSGRGSIYDDINIDVTAWLLVQIPDNAATQANCPWMIDETFKSYIVKKLKGDIK